MCPLSTSQGVAVPVVFCSLVHQPLRMGVIRAGAVVPYLSAFVGAWI